MAKEKKRPKTENVHISDSDIIERFLTKNVSKHTNLPLDIKIVEKIYVEVLLAGNFDQKDVFVLEENGYFKDYLWPLFISKNFEPELPLQPSLERLITSIILVFPYKASFLSDSQNTRHVSSLIQYSFNHCIYYFDNPESCVHYLFFLKACFFNIDNTIMRQICLKYTTISIWKYLTPSFLDKVLSKNALLMKAWKRLKQEVHETSLCPPERCLCELIQLWKKNLASGHSYDHLLDFFTVLLSQMSTRRFLVDMLYDQCIPYYLFMINSKSANGLIVLFLSTLLSMEGDEIPTIDSLYMSQFTRIEQLQRMAFQDFRPELESFAFLPLCDFFTDALQSILSSIPVNIKKSFLVKCGLLSNSFIDKADQSNELLEAIFTFSCRSIQYHPVYLMTNNDHGNYLPNLTLQYISLSDYLFRHLMLYKVDLYYSLEQEIDRAILEMKPKLGLNNKLEMPGWSKIAVPVQFVNTKQSIINVCYGVSRHHSNRQWDTDIFPGDFLVLVKLERVNRNFSMKGMLIGKFISFVDSSGKETKRSQHGDERMLRMSLMDGYTSLNDVFHIILKTTLDFGTLLLIKNAMVRPFSVRLPKWLCEFYLGYGNAPQQDSPDDIGNSITCIVTPPGTDDTQVIDTIKKVYSNSHDERIILMTRSNDVLVELLDNISVALDLPLYITILDNDVGSIWSPSDRIENIHKERARLLALVDNLASSLELSTADYGSSCETAQNFFITHIQPLWETFASSKGEKFPFLSFISLGNTINDMKEWSNIYIKDIKSIFTSLEKLRPLEIIKNSQQQQIYYHSQLARIFGVTCQSKHGLNDSIYRDWEEETVTLIIHESSHILEIEIGLMILSLGSLIKSIILIGDEEQLPPIVHCKKLSREKHFDLSLFSRMLRLGSEPIISNSQTKYKPTLSKLIKWNYPFLKDIVSLQLDPPKGFIYDYQWIDVCPYDDQEYNEDQNLAEAEYICMVYQYMRLLGHEKKRISILSMNLGQVELIIKVMKSKCTGTFDKLFGVPYIGTIDEYQGIYNDYILLSMVSKNQDIKYINDKRRLIVAFSRAKLGLYVFGKWDLFQYSSEFGNILEHFQEIPRQLMLAPNISIPSLQGMSDYLNQNFSHKLKDQ